MATRGKSDPKKRAAHINGEGEMKVGDIITLSPNDYPRYRGLAGVLVEEKYIDKWVVFINGRIHPFIVHSFDIVRLTNESR